MYKINDYIVYQKDICKIKDIKENYIDNINYYILEPVSDASLKLKIPTSSKYIRDIMSQDEVNKLINNIPNIEIIDSNDKYIESEYKKLLNGTHEDLIKIIKTTYLRNKKRIDSKKKISDKDKNYFELAEKYLYTEFSIVLNKSFDETKKYVISEVEKELSHE